MPELRPENLPLTGHRRSKEDSLVRPILTVTPNPAYDVTYVVPRVEPGRVHRVTEVRERPGGKGINVARVLARIGETVRAMGFADEAFAAALDEEGVAHDLVRALPRVRRTLVVQGAETTSFWEPGHDLAAGAEDDLMRRVEARLSGARGLVVSGSLPSGADATLPARLARVAVGAGVPVIVDADGDALRHAARVPGVVLMPNIDEVQLLTDGSPGWLDACRTLVCSGVRAVLATRGVEGITAVTTDGSWNATPGERLDGNPTGAGDAAAAAAIANLVRDPVDWPALLADAVATSGGAVVAPVAGEIEAATRDRLRPLVAVEQIEEEVAP